MNIVIAPGTGPWRDERDWGMRLWRRKGHRADPSDTSQKVVTVANVYGLGDGSPLTLAAEPDLARLLADPNPVPPQASASAYWAGPTSIRFALVIGCLCHPDPRVRASAIDLGVQQCGHTYGFQDQLVRLAADVDPVVRLTAVRTLWMVETETYCEPAVQALRDEIRGHGNEFDPANAAQPRLEPARARAALDLLVRHAPDASAREELRALIDKYVTPPD